MCVRQSCIGFLFIHDTQLLVLTLSFHRGDKAQETAETQISGHANCQSKQGNGWEC